MMTMLTAFALAAAPRPAPPHEQILAGPAFERLVHDAKAHCPGSQVRYATAAALLDTEDSFTEQLPHRLALRLKRASPLAPDGGPLACADSPGGASCPASAALRGIGRAGLQPRFVRFVCARGDSAWN